MFWGSFTISSMFVRQGVLLWINKIEIYYSLHLASYLSVCVLVFACSNIACLHLQVDTGQEYQRFQRQPSIGSVSGLVEDPEKHFGTENSG